MKKCNTCGIEKSLDEFHLASKSKDGHRSNCKECRKKYSKENSAHINAKSIEWAKNNRERHLNNRRTWYANNSDYVKARSYKWREDNPEKAFAADKKYSEANKDKRKLWKHDWDIAHPEKTKSYSLKRRTLENENDAYSVSERFLINLYLSACVECGSFKDIHADHIIPLSRGGTYSEGNLQPLCAFCNLSKKNKTMSEWRFWKMKVKKI